jgi:hypothetical protein
MNPITPEKDKLGFVGVGSIGRPIAQSLLGFGFLSRVSRDAAHGVEISVPRPIYVVCSALLREPYIFCYSLCEFLVGRRSVSANHSISMTSLHCEQARDSKRQECH